MSYSGSPAHPATALKRIGGHPILQNAVAALIPSLNLNGVSPLSADSGIQALSDVLARLFYGMARKGQLPSALQQVNARTQTPVLAKVVAGSIVLAAALLVPFEGLLVTTNALTLGVFVLVDLALWRIQRKAPGTRSTFVAPRWVPLLGALVALTLMLGEFLL